jgi:hypothetical protein
MKYLVKLFSVYTEEEKPKIVVSLSFSRRPIFHQTNFENSFNFIREVASRKSYFRNYFRRS